MDTQKLGMLFFGLALLASSGCNNNLGSGSAQKSDATLVNTAGTVLLPKGINFESRINSQQVQLFVIKSKSLTAAITNYGGRIVSLLVKDKLGVTHDVVLGYDELKSYQKPKEPFFGALIGRYGNRIARGKFTLAGGQFKLDINDGVNTLHGGANGFYKQVWSAKQIDSSTLELRYISKNGECGYPGNLTIKVIYSLTSDAGLKINYTASTDKLTVVNLTNHAYFNLSGAGSKTITDHVLRINADRYTPVDATLIPTGNLELVKGTPFDFTISKTIGAEINSVNEQLKNGKGYDHNWVLNKSNGPAAVVTSPVTGITMEVYTEEPGIQFYTGNFLTGKDHDGKGKAAYEYRSAFCLETQHFPDSPNEPAFPSTELKPGQVYHTSTTYKFLN